MIKNFWLILRARKSFKLPKKNQLIILESTGSDKIKNFLLNNRSFTIVFNRYEELNIPILLFSILYLRKYGFNAYEICLIKYIGAKNAITWIDTSYNWCIILNEIDNCKLFLIQNGRISINRFSFLKKGQTLFADYYFINGSYVKNFISKKLKAKLIVSGSIIANDFHKCKIGKTVDTIQWISQFRLHDKSGVTGIQKNFEKLTFKIAPILQDFAKNNNLKLEIISNIGNYLEKEFYSKILKDFEFISTNKNKDPYGSYTSLKSNALIVGVDSQLLYEAFSLGYRTVFFSSLGTLVKDKSRNFSWPNTVSDFGPFWANEFDIDKYNQILNRLLHATREEILSFYNDHAGVMHYDYKNKKVKNILKNEIY